MSQLKLAREVGLFGAIMMGLGSIVGTGVFVSIGIAADIAGPYVLLAVALAAGAATCNALSSAQLAANHPVSGGTYEYGYKYLRPWLGFSAGWMFLAAKTASAASAALGFAGYLLHAAGGTARSLPYLAVATVGIVTAIVIAGIRLSNRVNIVIVSVTLVSLLSFVLVGFSESDMGRIRFDLQAPGLLNATALLFVAYTGYGRIATLGEEVSEPRHTIPRAIIPTLLISMALYLSVAAVYVGVAPSEAASAAQMTAPLVVAGAGFAMPVRVVVTVGAMTAMLGVLLNLVLGLSRMLLAMGRRGDMPRRFADVSQSVLAVGVVIGATAALGGIKTIWSFSAFTVLVYYAVTNLGALRLNREERLYSSLWAWVGLLACLTLAFSINTQVWVTGLGLLALGLIWHAYRRRQAL